LFRGKDVEDINQLKREGLSIRAISKLTGYDRKTIRKYLLKPVVRPVYGARPPAASKLDPFKPYLNERLQAGVWECTSVVAGLAGAQLRWRLPGNTRFYLVMDHTRSRVLRISALVRYFLRDLNCSGRTALLPFRSFLYSPMMFCLLRGSKPRVLACQVPTAREPPDPSEAMRSRGAGGGVAVHADASSASTKLGKSSNTHLFFSVR
jgi:hypothetical protein